MSSLPLTVLPSVIPHWPAEITSPHEGLSRTEGQESLAEEGVRAPTFAVYTLGCKVNAADTSSLARVLAAHGFRMVPFRERADLYVVDTCTVTQEADKKSRKIAARARRNNPDGVVAVTGCAATRDAAQFERVAPGALVLSNARKWELPQLALQSLRAQPDWARDYDRYRREAGSEPVPSPTRERAVLKIQDGCNHRCAFCIIPRVRGRSTLKSRAVALAEARELVAEGARELVVTGVSLGDWDLDGMEGATARSSRTAALCALLRDIAELSGLARLRVSSIDVADADEAFLTLVATHPKICPHLHLALQSGSRTTLRRMRRRYTPERFLCVARRWRELRPDGGLTTDVIVGFPGETREEWEESLQLVREAAFSSVHVFPYSPREGTYAAENLEALGGLVPFAEQSRRVDELLALSAELSRDYASQFVGLTLPIMLEGEMPRHEGAVTLQGEGLTPHYVKVSIRNVPLGARRGDVVPVQLGAWDGESLSGEVVDASTATLALSS